MVITTDMLAAFVKVAESLSVSAAAVELGVGKGLVSKRVAQLETLVGATLFSRGSRKVSLTPAGEAYLDGARRALSEIASAQERLVDLREQISGEIRVTAPVSWGQRVLAKRLPEFLKRHPAIRIDLQLADRVMDVAHERIDVALRWTTTPPPPGILAVPIARVAWLLVASPAYLDSAASLRVPADLMAHPGLCYWRDHGDDHWVLGRSDGERCRIRVTGRYHVDNPEAVADAAMAGLGVALLPDYLCGEAMAEGRLLRVLPQWDPLTKFGTTITAMLAPERTGLARNRALLQFLKHELS